MPNEQDLNPDPRAECASNVEKDDPGRGSLRLARLRILRVHDGVHPDANFADPYEVGDPGVRERLRVGEACQHGGKRHAERKFFMCASM
jgi:hypothetical protein